MSAMDPLKVLVGGLYPEIIKPHFMSWLGEVGVMMDQAHDAYLAP